MDTLPELLAAVALVYVAGLLLGLAAHRRPRARPGVARYWPDQPQL